MKKVAIILIAVLVIFGSSYYYFIGTPSYSLYQTKKAIQNHDSVSFNKYVDMDRVAGSLFDSASKDFDDEMKKQENPFGIFGKGMIDAMIPGLKEQIKNEINKSIEEISEGNGSGFTDTKIKEIFEEGKSAKVILINSDNETIELSMIQFPERYWRVVKINLDDFKKINPNVIKNSDTSSKNNPESDEIIIDRKVGDDVELTTMKLKFNTIDEKQSINRKYGDVKKAKENTKFILINLTVTKITKEGFSFDSDGIRLSDEQGRKFDTWADSIGGIDNYLEMRDLQPSIPETGMMVYEVPNDTTSYTINMGKKGTNEIYRVRLK